MRCIAWFVMVLVIGSVLTRLAPMGELPWDLRAIGYLAVVALLPWVVWRWLRTPLEFIVGVFLLCQAALAFTGQTYGFGPSTAVFPLASIALIVLIPVLLLGWFLTWALRFEYWRICRNCGHKTPTA